MPRLHRSLLTVLFLIAGQQLHAQVSTWSIDGPAFSAAPAAIQSAAANVRAEPLMAVTVLFEQEHYMLAADGRTTFVHQLLYRIEDKTGVEGWNQTSVEWNPWYQNQPVIKARVIQTDGRVSELDPHTLTDIPANNESEDTFSDGRIYKGPLPAVAIGSIVEEETTVTDKLPFFSGGGIYRAYFSRSVPVLRSRLIVETPLGAPLIVKLHSMPDSVAMQDTKADGVRRMSYDLSSVPLALNSDIALATDKPRMGFIEFATGESWASVAAVYQKLAEPQIQPERIKALLPSTAQGDSLAAIQVLVSRLHKEIRYTGIEFGESALRPQTPAEILKRHYGDCKDKAAFLVAMLRASGIPASLALLSTGPGYDVNTELPGMNQFNHAIVYVPANAIGRPELWIDATAEFTHVGDLPYADQGRMALIIADGTKGLTRTPDAKPEDSVVVETREVFLKQFGPARIVESSSTTGHIDADYRYRYGGAETKASREDLEQYAKRQYAAKALTHIEHTEGSDLEKPFLLRLDMEKAARGSSGLTDAAVGVPPAGTLSMLPSWFFTDPDEDGTKLTPEQKDDRAKAMQQRATEYLIEPFISEMRYRVALPVGFVPRALPEDQTLQLGPAVLTRHFAVEPSSASPAFVTAVFRFNTMKKRYSTDEALALRKAVLELNKQNYLLLQLDQAGAKFLADGKVREGLAADRSLIAEQPGEAMHHVQLSAALLSAGLGEEARREARLATTIDPKLQIAYLQLAETLENNRIGVQFGQGFDRKGALEAYRKAKQLDPEDTAARTDLAILYEYNDAGERYAEGSDLAEAVKEYRDLKTIDEDAAARYEDSLLYSLLYDRRFPELIAELKTLPTNPTRDAMAIAAVAASQGAPAAIQRADLVSGDNQQKSAALGLAGLQLIRLQLYPVASEMLSAGMQNQPDSARLAQQIAIFGKLHVANLDPLPPTDPQAPVHLMLTSMMTSTMQQQVAHFLDRNAYGTDAEWKHNLEHNDSSGLLHTMAQQSQLPSAVMRDVVLGNAKLAATGDDAKGYNVALGALGASPRSLFVSRDEGQYRIIADSTDSAEIGNYTIYLLDHNREPEARNLLDWKRETVHRGGGDDPFDGDLFARFWAANPGPSSNTGTAAIRIAALALTLNKIASQVSLEPALAASKAAPDNADLTLLLANAYLNHEEPKSALPYVQKLLTQSPDSITAIRLAGQTYFQMHDFAAWSAMLKPRLAERPADHDLLVQSAREAEAESDFGRARAALQQVIDDGKATSYDYNGFAWLGLFDDHLDAKTIEAAQQATSITKNASFAEIHTLACLYAAQGKTTEARQLLLAGMATRNEAEPDSEVWFGFGSIYEQFGANEAAIAAYHKVVKPETKIIDSTDTYVLAQKRLASLHAN